MEQIIQQVVHGALDYGELEQLGFSPEEILDFSVNTNPYGPSPQVRQALAGVAIDRYPDRECLELRRALLAYEFCDTPITLDSLLCGNGTAELIWAIARAFLPAGSKAAILGPTFGEYTAASRACGAQVVEYRAVGVCREESCAHKGAELIAWLQTEQPTVLWLCNPNNPTGIWLDQQVMSQIADVCAHIGTALVVDEAYWHFLMPREAFSAVALLDRQGAKPVGANLKAQRGNGATGDRKGQYRSNNELDRGETSPTGSAQGPLPTSSLPPTPTRPLHSGGLLSQDGVCRRGRGGGEGWRGPCADPGSPSTPYLSGIDRKGRDGEMPSSTPRHLNGQTPPPRGTSIPRDVDDGFTPSRPLRSPVPHANPSPTTAPLIVLRSLTKTYALAGLRLGYAVASASVIAQIQQQLPSWNVNSCAQAAGIAALADRAHCTRTLAELAVQCRNFFHALSCLDISVIPSRTHFCLIDVGDAHRVRQQLLHRRLLVRDCASFGLPTYVRVATRQRDDWQQLLLALQEVVCH